MQLVSIGADPELFVQEKGSITSVIGHLGGSKYEPRKINGYGLQEDNVLAEFSMPACEACMGANYFSVKVLAGITEVQKALKPKGLNTHAASSWLFKEDSLKQWGPKALEFGCDPDFNAYTGLENPSPDNTSCLRTAGGHVHVGYRAKDDTISRMVVMAMDIFLGVPSVLMDMDTRRRSMYGKAGAYRQKVYGVEYRTLSNFWIHKAVTREWVFNQSRQALKAADNVFLMHKLVSADVIQDCINESNVDLARDIVRRFNLNVVEDKYAQVA